MTLAPRENQKVTHPVHEGVREGRSEPHPERPVKKLLILAAIIAVLILVTVVRVNVGDQRRTTVQTQAVTARAIYSSILASGELSYERQALLTSELIGQVKAIHVQESDVVKREQLVLEIDDEAFVADVAQRRAQVRAQEIAIARAEVDARQAEREVDRSRKLYEEDRLVTAEFHEERKRTYDVSLLTVKATRAQLDLAREELRKSLNGLEKTRIASPLDGVVIAVDIKVGETAIPSISGIPGSQLVTIADPSSIYAKVYVDEADIANLRLGNKAQVVVTSAPDRPITGRVDRIATSGRVPPGRQGLSFAVGLTFDDPNPQLLRPGVSCRAEILVTGREDVLSVPIQAVRTEESGNATQQYVFVVRDDSAQRIDVKTGIADDKYMEIVGGLKAGDRIITGPDSALQTLRSGDRITVDNHRA